MPELPEVEALAHHLRGHVVGAVLARADLTAIAALKTFDPPLHSLEGQQVGGVRRIGKYLIVEFDGVALVVHFARGGWLHWRDEVPEATPRPGRGPLALRGSFVTVDGEPCGGFDVTEAGTTKGLAIFVTDDPLGLEGVARLGPDALNINADELSAMLTLHERTQIKSLLRDQRVIAGIGNAYSDEILHLARISPFAPSGSIDAVDLHSAIVEILSGALDRAIASDLARLKAEKREGLRVHGRAGEPCPVCDDVIRTVSFADRSLEYCPTCQTEGRELADRRLSRLLK